MHGQFVWYELHTPDPAAAIQFYPQFTGWGTQPFDNDYTMWTTNGAPFAGIFRLNDEMRAMGVPPNWMPYVEADDVDATVARATALGARVMAGPDNVPGVGRYAVVVDPQGAAFGVYKSIHPSESWDGTPVLGRMSWHELMTTDHRAAFDFYRALFGWEINGEMDMGGGNMYSMYGHGPAMYGGMFTMGPEFGGMPPFWLCYIHVKDVGKAVDTATRAGATVQRPRMDIPGGTIAILGDPQGAGFAVHDMNPMPAAEPAPKPAATKPAKTAAKKTKAVAKKTKTVAKKAKPAAKKKAAAKKKPAKRVARKPAKAGRAAVAKKKSKRGTGSKPQKRAARKTARRPAKSARRTGTKSRRPAKGKK